MKKLYALTLALFGLVLYSHAQNDCSDGRYNTSKSQLISIIPNIPYGLAEVVFDSLHVPSPLDTLIKPFPLLMDVYQPLTDSNNTVKNRPVIIWAFGGAFVYGDKLSPDIVKFCTQYAQMGYICISISYRLSDDIVLNPSPETVTRAVLKGTHDMRAAVRFVRKQAAEYANILNIDTNQIYVAGVSACAFCAIHTAYLDKDEEIPPVLRAEFERTGGLEGRSGNPGYSSKVNGVINLCGAIGDTAWIAPGDVPIVSMHGTADGTVPYDADTVRILGINYPVHGSASIHRHIRALNTNNPNNQIANDFYTWEGADHVPFVTDSAYADTAFWFTRDFMYKRVCEATVGVTPVVSKAQDQLIVAPNPANNLLNIVVNSANYTLDIISLTGKLIQTENVRGLAKQIDVSALPRGIYFVRALTADGQILTKKILLD